MQFPFNLFSDLLAEFQKYLTNHIARPIYWVTGLVVATLGLLASYLAGWNTLLDSWNKTDTSLKLVLSGVVAVAFLLLAYLLGRLQSTVERWFQGELPRRLQARSLERHRAIWQTQQDTAQKMGDIYGKLYIAVKEMTQSETPPVAVASVSLSSTSIDDLIEQLAQEYEAGKQWLKSLRDGIVETDIPPHKKVLNEAFVRIDEQAATINPKQRETWLGQINDYRNKWIRLLQETYKEIEYRIDKQKKTFFLYYPATIERVAPTAIGNVFSAVDSYCDRLYGIDIALLLPRLHAVMEDSTRDQLTKAHDQLELFEWLYLGSIAVGLIGTLMAYCAQHYLLALLLWTLILPIPQLILYPAALKAALDYGAALRLAVDTERGKIISQAGFSLLSPTSQEQEKALWKKIQQWWMYGISPGDYTLTMEGTTKSDTNTEQTT